MIKERVRAVYNSLLYKKMPARMIVKMVYNAIYWINAVPARECVSEIHGPSTIVTGQMAKYNTHCKLEFGTYCQVYRDTNNSMTSRTVGAQATRPMGNIKGGHYCLLLETRKRISGYKFTALPVLLVPCSSSDQDCQYVSF